MSSQTMAVSPITRRSVSWTASFLSASVEGRLMSQSSRRRSLSCAMVPGIPGVAGERISSRRSLADRTQCRTERGKRGSRSRVEKARKWEKSKTVETRAEQIAKMREHVFKGWVNSNGKPVGFHHEGGGAKPPEGVRIIKRLPADSRGVYRAIIEGVKGEKRYVKRDHHTFFPESWTKAQVEKAIWEAHANNPVKVKYNIYRGKTSDGMVIEMYYNRNNMPRNAFPKREGDR